MVAVLAILDGASEPLGGRPTSLERARTPTLDRLAAEGGLSRQRTVPEGLPAGSESAIPTLLGARLGAPLDRGMVEAAAHEICVAAGQRAWRVDVTGEGGERAPPGAALARVAWLTPRLPLHTVRVTSGHRLLVVGPPPLPELLVREGGLCVRYGGLRVRPEGGLRVWPEGGLPERTLDGETAVIAARGAAAGIARLMGARAIVPAGTTGGPDSDLAAKARRACEEIERGRRRVVVHVGAADEAAHARDAAGKVAALERIDRELLAPLADAVARAGGTLRVCPDHACDPRTGAHDASPVPCLDWPAPAAGGGPARAGQWLAEETEGASESSLGPRRPARLTERAVVSLPIQPPQAAPAWMEQGRAPGWEAGDSPMGEVVTVAGALA